MYLSLITGLMADASFNTAFPIYIYDLETHVYTDELKQEYS